MMINTIIFDMDGTVMNTLEDLTDSVNYVLSEFGMPLRNSDEYRRFFGNGIRFAMECAVPAGTSADVIDKMLPVFRDYYNEHCFDKTGPYDGILSLMKSFKKKGYKMAIVSNKIDSAVAELNDRFFSAYVNVAVGERQGIKRKPAADMVLAALYELQSTREEAIYIGDSEVDLETAQNAGLPCISVLWGFRDKEFLIEKGAEYFAETPDDLERIIAEITV